MVIPLSLVSTAWHLVFSFYTTIGPIQEPSRNFKDSFLLAVDESNSYGQAQFTKRYRIDPKTASAMYGFQESWWFQTSI